MNDLYRVATGELAHTFMGGCPDATNGYGARDEACPACKVLMRAPAGDVARDAARYRLIRWQLMTRGVFPKGLERGEAITDADYDARVDWYAQRAGPAAMKQDAEERGRG